MRVFSIIASALVLFAFVGTAAAQNVYIGIGGDKTVISGVITKKGGDYMYLSVNGEEVHVETDDLDLDEAQDGLIKIGDRVQLEGEFDNNDFEAKSLVLLEAGANTNVIVGE